MKAKEVLNSKQLGKIINIRAIYGKSKISDISIKMNGELKKNMLVGVFYLIKEFI